MVISIQQGNLNVAIDLGEDTFDKSVSCEEVLLAAFDIISRIYFPAWRCKGLLSAQS